MEDGQALPWEISVARLSGLEFSDWILKCLLANG